MKARAIPYPMVSAMSPARIGDTEESPIFPVKRKPTRVPATCGGAASMAADSTHKLLIQMDMMLEQCCYNNRQFISIVIAIIAIISTHLCLSLH